MFDLRGSCPFYRMLVDVLFNLRPMLFTFLLMTGENCFSIYKLCKLKTSRKRG